MSSAALPAAACSVRRANAEAPLIDNFEADPRRILTNDGRGGWWFGYDDGTRGHILREVQLLMPQGAAGHGLHVVSSGFLRWGAGFGATLHPASSQAKGCPYDASMYSGVRVRARGEGRLRMMLADANRTPVTQGGTCTLAGSHCHDRHGVWIELGDVWKTYEFPFCSFAPEGWGGPSAPLDPSRLFAVHFRAGARERVEIWLDDLSFYRAAAEAAPLQCAATCPLDAVPRSANLAPSVTTAPQTKTLSLHTFEQPTRSCGNITRRYLSYVPERLGRQTTAPILILLHGSSANAESARTFMARERFDALAERDGFVAIYGNAAPGAHTSSDVRFANTGAWRQDFFDDGQVDDVDYLLRVLEDLRARDVVRGDNPLYLTGISNGGGMVLEAARRIPQRILGVAAWMPFAGHVPKPVPNLVATRLTRLLIAYSIGDPGMGPDYHDVLAPLPNQWALAMGIPMASLRSARVTSLPDVVAEGSAYRGNDTVALRTRNSRVTQSDIVGPDHRARVRVLVMDHAGHFWPNPVGDTEDWVIAHWGFRNQDFDAADQTWDFLRGIEGAE